MQSSLLCDTGVQSGVRAVVKSELCKHRACGCPLLVWADLCRVRSVDVPPEYRLSKTEYRTEMVQTEIKKTWTRWNLAFEWEGPVVCGRYRYGSVVVGINNNSTSSQSHLAGGGPSTRSTTLVSSRVYRSTAPPMVNMHATLPGYVISNSDPSIPEEPEDSGPKRVDDISLKENLPVLSTSATAEDEEETL